MKQIARTVMAELKAIQPGCIHTIAGEYDPLLLFYAEEPDLYYPSSYRRGKPESNDVDIVVTHPNADKKKIRELCQQLIDVLSEKGLVTHVMSESEHHLTPIRCWQHSRDTGTQLSRDRIRRSHHIRTSSQRLLPFSHFLVPTRALDWT